MAADDDRRIESQPQERAPLDADRSIDRIVWIVGAACAFLVVIDPFIHKHGKFEIEHVWGFYAIFGLAACVGLILVANLMRPVLTRREDYYDE